MIPCRIPKHSKDLKKADYKLRFRNPKHPFLHQLNGKTGDMDTLGAAFADSLQGINIFKISKRRITIFIVETPNTLSYTNKMERGIKWTP